MHPDLNERGGAELVAVTTMETLCEMGFNIDLVTIKKPNAAALKKAFNVDLDVESIKFVLPSNVNYKKSIYSQLIMQLLTLPLNLCDKADLIINTHADFPLPYFRYKIPLISYVHFPYISHILSPKDYPLRYQRSPLWKLYFAPYNIVSSWISPFLVFTLKKSFLLTNSEFTKKAIIRVVPEAHPIVVRPPVDTSDFVDALASNCRENKILVIGRIAPEKQLEKVIEVCRLLDVAVNVTIVGSFDYSPRAFDYLKKMRKMIEKYGLNDRVKILVNIDRDNLKKQMKTAKIYLHTKYDEHFGISIIEAISAGLIPIVPIYGGPVEFIPKRYLYHTIREAAELVSKNLDVPQSERLAVSKISDKFSREKFKLKIKKIINYVLQLQGS